MRRADARPVKKFSLIVVAVSLVVSACAQLPIDPPGSSPQHLAGLQGPAHVIRDGRDIPHIIAGNDHDAFFLQGYVHASDRLFQMDLLRRQASGTQAELLGPDLAQR